MKVKKNPLKLLSQYMEGYDKLIVLGRILAAASALVAMFTYYEIWRILKIALSGENLDTIPKIGWMAVTIMLGSMFMYILALMCTHIAAFHIQATMREKLMKHILTLPLGIFDEEGTGRVRRVVKDSTAATENYVAHIVPDKAVALATPIGLAVLMLAFDWRIGLLCLVPIAIGFCFVASMMGPKMQESMRYYQTALENISNEGVEYVRGIPVVKTFGQTVFSFKRFSKAIDDYTDWTINYTKNMTMPMVKYMTAINSVFVALVVAAYIFSTKGVSQELVLNMMYYIIITHLLTVAMTKLVYSGEQEMTLVDAIERVNKILNMESLDSEGKQEMPKDCSISFKDVSYRYANAKRDAISHLSIEIPAGAHVALVGPSGGGKSTIAQLMARFFDVTSGSISIGGVDIRDIKAKDLMANVSFVFQDSKLLKRTIADNVRLGNTNASDEEVLEALRRAQCMDIINKLPKGINTVIGEKGTYLSGGEVQRIAIARAFLKDAPIIILDEATAFADPDNEASVQKAFEELSKNKTVIMIAHRLSTVVDANCIYLLENGTCTEFGSHTELMAKRGHYCSMFEEYNRSVLWKVGA